MNKFALHYLSCFHKAAEEAAAKAPKEGEAPPPPPPPILPIPGHPKLLRPAHDFFNDDPLRAPHVLSTTSLAVK
jgi:hypothetical protein